MAAPKADVAAVLAMARAQLGVHEDPPRSNRTKYGEWYGFNGVAWCAISLTWVFAHAGHPLPEIERNKRHTGFAYTPSAAAWAKRNGCWADKTVVPEPGWVVLWDFPGDGVNRISHTSIVKFRPTGDLLTTYDGNTNDAQGRTGGQYRECTRSISRNVVGYLMIDDIGSGPKPPPPEEARTTLKQGDKGPDVKFAQAMLNIVTPALKAAGFGDGQRLEEDGDYGPRTTARVLEFERYWNKKGPGQKKPLMQDGIFTVGTAEALAAIVTLVTSKEGN